MTEERATEEQNAAVEAREERRQLVTTLAALVISGLGAVSLTLASRRVPVLRDLLRSSRWRMRATIAGFTLSYNLISRLLQRADEAEGQDDAAREESPH